MSLFSYEDRIKERFYILEEQQEQPAELAFREYFREGTASLVTENSYRNQLKNVLHTRGLYTDNLGERIDDATYDERELKRIITRMNKSGNEEYVEEKRSSSTNWFAGIGLQNNNMHFEGDHHLARREIDNNSPWLPKISAGIDLYANPAVGKIFYRLELAYQVNKSTIVASIDNDTKAVYEFSGSSISLQPQIHYVIYNSPKLKIPLAVGAGYGHASYSKNLYKKVYTSGEENDHHQNWLNLKKSITSLFVKGSVIVNRKIETAFRYELPQRPAGNARYSLMTQNIQVQVYYLFGKKS